MWGRVCEVGSRDWHLNTSPEKKLLKSIDFGEFWRLCKTADDLSVLEGLPQNLSAVCTSSRVVLQEESGGEVELPLPLPRPCCSHISTIHWRRSFTVWSEFVCSCCRYKIWIWTTAERRRSRDWPMNLRTWPPSVSSTSDWRRLRVFQICRHSERYCWMLVTLQLAVARHALTWRSKGHRSRSHGYENCHGRMSVLLLPAWDCTSYDCWGFCLMCIKAECTEVDLFLS